MSSSTLFDFTAGFFRVVSTSLAAKTKSVLLTMAGPGDEEADDQLAYGGLGLLGRPRDEDGDNHVDVVALRAGDRVVPIAYRDTRLDGAFPNGLASGTIALAGYGGGFLSLSDTDDSDKNTIATIYVPYAFSGGAPTKALAVALDPKQESISLVHGDGYAVTLAKDTGITMRADASTWLTLKPGEFNVVAAKCSINGSVAVGANTATALPFAGGPAMPPSLSFFYSP
ncbi:MAG TPA: hypothetical protein VH062_02190 [Polyangiaceae bacterium]|jgi:hypothetical protein|nr:hypothetical protein [Polyangiaceae bacterium]